MACYKSKQLLPLPSSVGLQHNPILSIKIVGICSPRNCCLLPCSPRSWPVVLPSCLARRLTRGQTRRIRFEATARVWEPSSPTTRTVAMTSRYKTICPRTHVRCETQGTIHSDRSLVDHSFQLINANVGILDPNNCNVSSLVGEVQFNYTPPIHELTSRGFPRPHSFSCAGTLPSPFEQRL